MDRKRKYIRVQQPAKPVFDTRAKTKILQLTQDKIDSSKKLKKRVSRMAIRGNRLYLYELVEQFKPRGAIFMKPLIEGNYIELPYARITINDSGAVNCTADWQRHNKQWISIYKGTLLQCLANIENDSAWFSVEF